MSKHRRGPWWVSLLALMAVPALVAQKVESDPEETVQRRLDGACIVSVERQEYLVARAHEYLMRRCPDEEFVWLDRYPVTAGVPRLDERQYFLHMWMDLAAGRGEVFKVGTAAAREDATLLTMNLRYSADIFNYHRYLTPYHIPLSWFVPTRSESRIPEMLRWRLKNTRATIGRNMGTREFWDPLRRLPTQILVLPTQDRTVWIARAQLRRLLVIEYDPTWSTRRSWSSVRKAK